VGMVKLIKCLRFETCRSSSTIKSKSVQNLNQLGVYFLQASKNVTNRVMLNITGIHTTQVHMYKIITTSLAKRHFSFRKTATYTIVKNMIVAKPFTGQCLA